MPLAVKMYIVAVLVGLAAFASGGHGVIVLRASHSRNSYLT